MDESNINWKHDVNAVIKPSLACFKCFFTLESLNDVAVNFFLCLFTESWDYIVQIHYSEIKSEQNQL